MATVRRGFADLDRGQIHYRTSGKPEGTPLIMMHASPGSSKMLEPVIGSLGDSRHVIAPDTMGNGDSMPPEGVQPEIADYAAAVIGMMDSLGIQQADFYGTHTGARMATCLALNWPDRVRKVILDGFGLYTPDELDEILKTYAPEMKPDQLGLQVMWGWHFARDQYIYFPWFKKDKEHRVPLDLPSAEFLHDKFVEVMKGLTTYHKSYRAAFRYPMAVNVPKITQPTLITFATTDMVFPVLEEARGILPHAEYQALPGIRTEETLAETTAAFNRFLGT